MGKHSYESSSPSIKTLGMREDGWLFKDEAGVPQTNQGVGMGEGKSFPRENL